MYVRVRAKQPVPVNEPVRSVWVLFFWWGLGIGGGVRWFANIKMPSMCVCTFRSTENLSVIQKQRGNADSSKSFAGILGYVVFFERSQEGRDWEEVGGLDPTSKILFSGGSKSECFLQGI